MNRAAESADAFQAAVNLLPPSYDQAVARFKLGDALAARKQYPQALINYKWVADNAAGLESVQTNLVEQALYQVVRVARESGDSVAANAAMASLLEKFPNGFLAERSLMSLSPQVSGASDPVAAREVFLAFITNSPDSSLIPEVKLAVARTYEQQRDWRNALSEYDAWLTDFTDNPARPRAEYFKALTTARLGDESNALTLFTNYVAKFPTNEFTPLALWWTADHYWRQDDFVNAETYYQLLFKNHPGATNLIYQAQLMAGRAATARGGRPEEAVAYFTNLTSDANCPADIQAQALFAYGDTLMSLPSGDTNKPYGNLELAIQVFSKLAQLNPNTRIALLAQGKIGHCYLQLGGVDTNAASANYNFASNAYQRILTATNHVEFADRAEAEVGLGFVMEKQARLANGTNSVNLLRGALDHYLNIVYGHSRTLDDPADMFWVNRAGVERALPLAESLQLWDQVARLCDTLANLLPPMKPMLEKRRARAEEQLRKNSN
jgi:tetratricopeptide (TPR) repeat protein